MWVCTTLVGALVQQVQVHLSTYLLSHLSSFLIFSPSHFVLPLSLAQFHSSDS